MHQHKRFKQRTNWSSGDSLAQLQRAINLVRQEGLSVRKSAAQTGVPFTVLATRINGKLSIHSHAGVASTLSNAQEQQLVDFILDLAERGFGKDVMEVRQLAQRTSADPNFKASHMWCRHFLQEWKVQHPLETMDKRHVPHIMSSIWRKAMLVA